MTKKENDNAFVIQSFVIQISSFLLSFRISIFGLPLYPMRERWLKNDCLTACRPDANHGQFCFGLFGNVSDVFLRCRRKLRKSSSRMSRRVPSAHVCINWLTVGQLSRIAGRNTKALS